MCPGFLSSYKCLQVASCMRRAGSLIRAQGDDEGATGNDPKIAEQKL